MSPELRDFPKVPRDGGLLSAPTGGCLFLCRGEQGWAPMFSVASSRAPLVGVQESSGVDAFCPGWCPPEGESLTGVWTAGAGSGEVSGFSAPMRAAVRGSAGPAPACSEEQNS